MTVWYTDNSWKFSIDGTKFSVPIQGNAPDCAFISALVSLAWMGLTRNLATADTYSIQFFERAGVAPRSWDVTDKLPCVNGLPVYAKSSTNNEIWPGVYEKAYARFKLWLKYGIDTNADMVQDTNVSVSKFYDNIPWGGNPCEALTHLTGKSTITKQNSGVSDTTVYSLIKNKCDTTCGKTRQPTVAWTYPSAPAGVTYDNYNLVAGHSYSILGVWLTVKPPNNPLIILRNPFRRDSYSNPSLTWACNSLPLNERDDGIFALDPTTFQKAFEAWGYLI